MPDMMMLPPDMSAPVVVAGRKVLLMVEDPKLPSPGDVKLNDRMKARMMTVTYGDDDGPATASSGMDLIVISSGVRSGKVADKFRDVKIPVICMDAWVFAPMKMTGPAQDTDFGDTTGTQIAIAMANHPLAAKLSGTLTVAGQASPLSWGTPSATADKVATIPNQAAQAAIFAYRTGTMMVGLAAPAKRVGLFAAEPIADRFTADGTKLFDAAVDWALAN